MTRTAQARAPKPSEADSTPEATPAATAVAPSVPAALVAFAQLGAAIAAVARFPSQPVPERLVARIAEAQANVDAALEGGWDLPTGGGEGAAYDDAWIKERFDSLDAALKTKFEELNTSIDARFTELGGRIDGLTSTSQDD